MFAAGWKLNPVVGAVYSPEFYAGKDYAVVLHAIFYFSILYNMQKCRIYIWW